MKNIKVIAGTLWAILCLLFVLILFPGLESFSGSAARLPFMKINPNYTGGIVVKQVSHGQYVTEIRKPVFDGLTGERKKGFVQVDWKGQIPAELNDTIDYNSDGKPDFLISIDKRIPETELLPLDERVGTIRISTSTSYGWAVRVNLRK